MSSGLPSLVFFPPMDHSERFHQRLNYHLDTLLAAHGKQYVYLKDYVLSGGKQLRPRIFLETVSAWEGDITEDMLDVACALELLHAFFLVHDDIMDGDEMRRDKPTLHTQFLHQGMQDGVGKALVWGDVLYTEAFRLLLKYPDVACSHALASLMTDITLKTADGQLLEANRETLPSLEEILVFYEQKTALYSILLPLQAAAIVCRKEVPELHELSRHAGIAYQVNDDLIEVLGEKKRRMDDDRCGDILRLKPTPLLLKVYPELPEQIQATLLKKFQKGEDLTVQEEKVVLSTMETAGVLAFTKQLCRKHAEHALTLMQKMHVQPDHTLSHFLEKFLI